MTKLKTKQFVEGECPFGGCVFNEEGSCMNQDTGFLSERMTEILEDGDIEGEFYCPSLMLEDNKCPCGKTLADCSESLGNFDGREIKIDTKRCLKCE